jgi:hypothetical protein
MLRQLYMFTLNFIFMGNTLTMEMTTYTAFRQHLKTFLEKVISTVPHSL